MDLELDDDVFVRAPAADVYRTLIDLRGYDDWWPGIAVVRAAMGAATWDGESEGREHPLVGYPREPGGTVAVARLSIGRWRTVELILRPYRFRAEHGMLVDVGGDLTGTVEWWLEQGWDGVVVHHLSRIDVVGRRRATVAAAYRRSVRRALWALKDRLQTDVRVRLGLAP